MTQTLNVIIVDDEQPAVDILKHFVNKLSHLDLKLATTNSIEALDYIKHNTVDLVFLDIQMPDLNGIEFVNSLDSKTKIVFTTAFSEYAIDGFDLNILDYLLKPIRFGRFMQAVNKAGIKKSENVQESSSSLYLTIKVEYKTVRLAFSDIHYIEGCKDYVKIYYKDTMVLTRLNIKNILQKLPQDEFVRIHKSYIISLSKISSYQKLKLYIDKVEIPIGDQYKDDFFDVLKNY